MPPGRVFLAIACVVLATLRPAMAQVGSPAQKRAGERLGEAFTWTLGVAGQFDAGHARLAVSPPVRSGTGWQVQVVGEAEATGLLRAFTGLHANYRLVLDGSTLLPRKVVIEESGLRSRTVVMQLDGRRFDAATHKADLDKRLTGILPSEPLEPVALLLLLRSARLEQGDRLELIVMDGSKFYQGSLEVLGREELKSALGPRRAIRLRCRGEAIDELGRKLGRPPRQATLFLSDDTYRLPLRIEVETDFGTGQFDLTSYEPARRPIPIPATLRGITERPHRLPAAASPSP